MIEKEEVVDSVIKKEEEEVVDSMMKEEEKEEEEVVDLKRSRMKVQKRFMRNVKHQHNHNRFQCIILYLLHLLHQTSRFPGNVLPTEQIPGSNQI